MPRLEDHTLAAFLEAIADKTPTPGGGAVASATGATAAALAGMVVAYSLGKKNLAEHQPVLERASGALTRAREIFLELAEEDAAGYALLNELLKLPESDPRRAREMPTAIASALAPPRAATAAAADLLRHIESLAPITNRHLRSDLAIAAVLAESAAKAAYWNVGANLSLLTDPAEREKVADEARSLVADAEKRRAGVEKACLFEGM
jgi:formiminotetrahydrofolate cyclodeaminase